jgi:ribosomal protein L10
MIAIDDDESEELDDEFTEESLFNTLTSLSGASLAKNLLDFEKSKWTVELLVVSANGQ